MRQRACDRCPKALQNNTSNPNFAIFTKFLKIKWDSKTVLVMSDWTRYKYQIWPMYSTERAWR
jgi:hypothetical protein